MKDILKIEDITISYYSGKKETNVLKNASFNIPSNEVVGLVGESGSGKSTTALAVMGLLPMVNARVTHGIIRFKDLIISEMPEKTIQKMRGKDISIIFQSPSDFFNPVLTIGTQFREYLRIHGVNKSEIEKRLTDLLKDVHLQNISGILESYPHQLSGGQLQKVSIAFAIALSPSLLIADEPTSALDTASRKEIALLLKEMVSNRRVSSMLLITHDLNFASPLCSRIVVMLKGFVLEIVNLKDLSDQPVHPYLNELLYCRNSYQRKEIKEIPEFDSRICPYLNFCSNKVEICKEKLPDMVEISNDHYIRCFNPMSLVKDER